ncbi:MAG: aminotransferase class V-fold PLP-dependent enzyme [archaeon]|nr:aminotransferase class V-fold PLP-dependent enzyme [archaeon]
MSTQAAHALLMIPGPTEFADDVLSAMATPGTSHVDPVFIEAFGRALDSLPGVFGASEAGALPLVLAGSGTLGWDVTAANFCVAGDEALVINTGYFGDSFAECLKAYGVAVTHLHAAEGRVGSVPSVGDLQRVLEGRVTPFKLITITHVDTSTGVRAPVQDYARCVRSLSPSSLIAIDGVCSIAAEQLRMTEWDLDIAFTGSQKALGVPPGLLIALFRPRALDVLRHRTSPIPAYAFFALHFLFFCSFIFFFSFSF